MEQGPELVVDDRTIGDDEPGATKQVTVHNRKAVRIRHGQSCCCPVIFVDLQVIGDRGGIGEQVAARQPDKLRRTGAARRRHQQREVRVQTMGAAWPAFDDAVVADDDVGVIAPLDCRLTTPGGHRQHHVTACQRTEIVNQRREVVARLEQYEPARHDRVAWRPRRPARRVRDSSATWSRSAQRPGRRSRADG